MMVGALALLAATVPIAGAGANGAPATSTGQTFTLFAGQDIPVGDVTVTNDSEGSLYVMFSTESSSWCMTETHLQVATSVEGIPQTKKFNPIPGQFEDSGDHPGCVKTVPYGPIYVGTFAVGTEIFVAAHAVVWDESDVSTLTFMSDVNDLGYGRVDTYGELAAASFGLVESISGWPWDSYGLGEWITIDVEGQDELSTQWARFEETFTMPDDFRLLSGVDMTVNTDNAEEIWFDGSMLTALSGNPSSWTAVATYGFEPAPGENTVKFIVENWPGNIGGNPMAVNWYGEATYLASVESAWSEGTEFADDRGWATYSTYTIQPVLIETVQVSSGDIVNNTNVVVWSNNVLESGVSYQLKATGTYVYWPAQLPDAGIADAHCSLRPPGSYNTGLEAAWINGDQLSNHGLEVWANSLPVSWIEDCNGAHGYTADVDGGGTTISFTINDSYYKDNSGFIPVEIWWLG